MILRNTYSVIKLDKFTLPDEDIILPEKKIVKIFAKDTPNIKLLGHLLSNESSRLIMDLLSHEEMHTNQIAKKSKISLENVSHHLRNLKKLDLVIITKKPIVRKGKDHEFYKMIPEFYVIISKTQKEIHETGFLKRIFKDSVKFVAIGIGAIISYAGIRLTFDNQQVLEPMGYVEPSIPLDDFWSLIIPIFVIMTGLIVERVFSYKKRKK